MGCKKYKDRIILYLYGELGQDEKAGVERHIEDCPECGRDFDFTRNIFEALDSARPEAPEAGWERCWAAIDTQIRTKGLQRRTVFSFPRWTYAATALLLVFILGSLIGRHLFFPAQPAPTEAVHPPGSLSLPFQEYFEELKPVLVEYSNYSPSKKREETITMDKEVARNLLIQNILLRSIAAATDPTLELVLEDLDIILKEIANLKKDDERTPGLIKDFIREREVLFKMEVLTKT